MIKEILQNIKDELTNNIKELGYYTENLEVVLEIPKDKENGDYATNVAMRLARVARKAPMVIAGEIIEKFNKEISKSGINHRIRKIKQIAKEIEDDKNEKK